MKTRLKINGFIIFVVIVLITAFPSLFFRYKHLSFFDEIAEIFGIAFILLGQIFRVSARGYKSEHSQNSHNLIEGGPYAMVRHPMYLGILLIGSGIVLILFRWWVTGIFLSVFIIRYITLIFKEEKKLLVMFPKEYPGYQKKVPRILPSMNALLQKDIREYLPLKLAWLKKEIGTILAVLLITLLIESWDDISHEGLRVYFKEVIAIAITIILFIGLIIYLIKRTVDIREDVSNKSKISL